ncbi:MAG: phosphoenolpyruvate synthase [Bacteriovoracaceae bacterium]
MDFIKRFDQIKIQDIPLVGGKNASLGEMYQALRPEGINLPEGFVITADAFSKLIEDQNLYEKIYPKLDTLNIKDINQLSSVGREIRSIIKSAGLPEAIKDEIKKAYLELCQRTKVTDIDVAVRSSATAEDLPEASFAGQQETFLNVKGEEALLEACSNCFASLFTDRAISYRVGNHFDHKKVRLSIGVQQMVRSDLASSGVIFTLDTESGSRNVILITSAYGLGENIVGGRVDPDEFLVLKPVLGKVKMPILRRKLGAKQVRMVYESHGTRTTKNVEVSKLDQENFSLTDTDIIQLAQWAYQIENHYSSLNQRETPMDIEWAKDGRTNELYILQARPETVHSSKGLKDLEVMSLKKKSKVLLTGKAVGSKIGVGPVRIINDVSELKSFKEGEILVAEMTDPDWEPVMKKASAIVTNRGGRTCHAAIVSREHGVPCVVGTGVATAILKNGQDVTVTCAEGEVGQIMEGQLPFSTEKISWSKYPKPKTKVMVNIGNPTEALKISMMPVDGVGLARLEFIIAEHVKIHPLALLHLEKLQKDQEQIKSIIAKYQSRPAQYFVAQLIEGIAMIGGAFYPRPVIVRLSDFKTNEYAHLLGGEQFEPKEENPMIGFRGASRYYHPNYREGFALECQALKYVRDEMGLTNIKIMIPFCRSAKEGELVIKEMEKNGLIRGENNLEVYVMCELPSNVLDIEAFAKVFDGFSIGSNDLTQMTLGVDRDSALVSSLFDERDPAVKKILAMAIEGAKKFHRHVGICGQAPSDYPEMAKFLVSKGIDSISLTPDSVLTTMRHISEAEI